MFLEAGKLILPPTVLLSLLEIKEIIVDKKGGAILRDLSKAFGSITHELLLAKLKAFGLSKQALLIILNNLNNRKQRVKTNNKSSSFLESLNSRSTLRVSF